jgi:hypothetical protein
LFNVTILKMKVINRSAFVFIVSIFIVKHLAM